MRGVFISGTDTMVGKTTVAAGLLRLILGFAEARYWKPVQTGRADEDDALAIQHLTDVPADALIPSVYQFAEPISPNLAAERENRVIEPRLLFERAHRHFSENSFLVVEGAGGLLVPFAPGLLQIDFIKRMEIAVLLVVDNRLGAINHTLLSLEACQRRGIPVLGVILNLTGELKGNREAIEEYGEIPVIAEFPRFETPAQLVEAVASHQGMRRSFREFLRS